MNNSVNQFIVPLITIWNRVFKGYGGIIKVIGEGTVRRKIEGDYEKLYSIIIHNANHASEPPICLLPPYQWDHQ